MAKKRTEQKEIVVSLDVGTSKICAVVAEVLPDKQLEILGYGIAASRGLKQGVVVNIEATVECIQQALEEAETRADVAISEVVLGISGAHIHSLNSHGIVAISEQEVKPQDIDRVIEAAKAVAIPADQKIIHVLPQAFTIDTQDGILDPIGMMGVRLEAHVHIITASANAVQNIVKCCQQCGIKVSDIVLQQLASSQVVLTEDEKELGVCMVDIGAGTTDLAIFVGGAIRHTSVIPIAGNHVTNDIAVMLRTPPKSAEMIKVKYACALAEIANSNESIEVMSAAHMRDAMDVSRKELAEVVQARYEELFLLVQDEIRRSGLDELIHTGLVLTGGGSCVEGVEMLAEKIFSKPVCRIGPSSGVFNNLETELTNPVYSTALGLLLCQLQQHGHHMENISGENIKKIFTRMKSWFKAF